MQKCMYVYICIFTCQHLWLCIIFSLGFDRYGSDSDIFSIFVFVAVIKIIKSDRFYYNYSRRDFQCVSAGIWFLLRWGKKKH